MGFAEEEPGPHKKYISYRTLCEHVQHSWMNDTPTKGTSPVLGVSTCTTGTNSGLEPRIRSMSALQWAARGVQG